MYEAMRQRAPFSARIVGISATILLGTAGGYVLLTGFGDIAVKAVQRSMTVVSLAPPPAKPADPPPVKFDKIDHLSLAKRDPVDLPPVKFTYEKPMDEGSRDISPYTTPHLDPLPPRAPVLTSPKMKPADPPPYPASEIRAGGQGTTALQLCIDVRGRVTSANIVRSSGHDVLDQAALKWVRDLRFSPGLSDGAARAVCGHPVEYVWNLETLRR